MILGGTTGENVARVFVFSSFSDRPCRINYLVGCSRPVYCAMLAVNEPRWCMRLSRRVFTRTQYLGQYGWCARMGGRYSTWVRPYAG